MKQGVIEYIRILLLTLSVQVVGWFLFILADRMIGATSNFPSIILLGTVAISLGLGIVLPMLRFRTWSTKLLGIILLPTNYAWVALAIYVGKVLKVIVEILTNLPENFG